MIPKTSTLRVARPTDDLKRLSQMYEAGLGFKRIGSFVDHDGFDGVILGHPHHSYHLEFTHHRNTPAGKAPTQDNLLVFYIPDKEDWACACTRMEEAQFKLVTSYNPYWDKMGKTFEDPDGYRVVLQNGIWEK